MIVWDKAKVKDAPRIDDDGALSVEDEQELYAYDGRGYTPHSGSDNPRPLPAPTMDTAAAPRATAPVTSSEGGASMVRSEEELAINKRTQEAGRVELRKWVETQDVNVTVPAQRQMARVVRVSTISLSRRGVVR